MQMQLIKEGIHSYLVIPRETESGETYENQLFQYHDVPYFLSYEIRTMNGQSSLYYRLQWHTSLYSVMGHLPFTYERVYRMVESVIDAICVLDDYLLEPDGIVWDSRAVFMDVETGGLQFCYYPDRDVSQGKLRDLITEWLQYIDKKQDDIVLLVMGFYDVVTEQEMTKEALVGFREKMKRHQRGSRDCLSEQRNEERVSGEGMVITEQEDSYPSEKENVPKESIKARREKGNELKIWNKQRSHKPRLLFLVTGIVALADLVLLIGWIAGVLSYVYMRYLLIGIVLLVGLVIGLIPDKEKESVDEIMQEYLQRNNERVKIHSGRLQEKSDRTEQGTQEILMDKENASQIGETTLLSQLDGMADTDNHLVAEHTNKILHLESLEKDRYPAITLQNGTVVIGSMAEGCTYVLKERGISRLHAKIMEKADGIYLLDLNSTNGTYLNGEEVEAGKDYKIEEGDLVAFAKCEYYVVLV